MNPIVASLLEFNNAFEIPKLDTPGHGPDELIELRIKLLMEEVQEYAEAARAGDLVEVLDALADIGYILAELEYSEHLFRKHREWPVIDVTQKAVEETAGTLLRIMGERGLGRDLGEVGQL